MVADVTLDVASLDEPAVGRLISIPATGRPALDDLFLRRGRWIEPDRPDEVLVSESFALAHHLGPGDSVTAVINGRRRKLAIVGVALSPEYVYSIRPGEVVPDDRLFGVFWMEKRALATAFDMQGGFDDVALKLTPGASDQEVIARLDRLLARYGGLGAIPRSQQISHWYLESELSSLQTVGLVVPVIFLAVAAFLLNVVLTRIVAVQREQIAALKALGYSEREIGWHYVEWGLVVAALGGAAGTGGGAWLGTVMIAMYNHFFRFPSLVYRLDPAIVVGGLAVTLAAAVLGALGAVRRAVRLPPAEAMRPEAPASYRRSVIERMGLGRLLPQPARMVIRNLERRPGRAIASVVGIACAAAMLVVGMFTLDAIDYVMRVVFQVAQRQDLTVNFVEPVSSRARYEVGRLPGAIYAEPARAVAARLSAGPRSRQVAISGLPAAALLNRVLDADEKPVVLPPEGLVLSSKLAEVLGVGPGDAVRVQVLEGARPVREVPVADVVEEYLGTSAYMEIGAVHRLMHEGGSLTGASIEADSAGLEKLYRRLKAIPKVAGVNLKSAALASFQRTLGDTLGLFVLFNAAFSAIIAFGVVYNAARVSLSERSRELASLRVLGFRRSEISAILLGELALLTLVAIPVGLLLGYALAGLVVKAYDTELYRFPLIIFPRTYAFAAGVVLAAAAASAFVVRRKLDRLDLVAVLKTRE